MNRLKMNLMILSAAFLLLGFAGDGFAQGRRGGVKRNGNCAKGSIKQGVRSGQLSNEEAQTIRQNQDALRQERRTYKVDGVLSEEERNDLRNDKRSLSKLIRQSRRN